MAIDRIFGANGLSAVKLLLGLKLSSLYWGVALLALVAVPARAGVILQYHHVSVDTPASTSTTPEQFLQHLKVIESEGFTVVPLAQLIANRSTRTTAQNDPEALAKKQVAITFDDGYRSVFTQAYPLLKARQWPFTVFINSEPVDAQSALHMSWDQLREMARHRATIANHTASHAHLLRRRDETQRHWRERVSIDILTAQVRLEEELGQTERMLAYPYGEFDTELLGLSRDLGFVAFGQHSGPVAGVHSLQTIPRFPFGGAYGRLSDFRMKLNTLAFPLERVALRGIGIAEDPLRLSGDEIQSLDLILSDELGSVRCFGPVTLDITQSHRQVQVKVVGQLPVGRSRINCTARHDSGRYHWFSQPFFRPSDKGIWLD